MDKNDLVKFRSECIAAHNFYRSLHGTTPLVWSGRLADGAQKWAEQLASADSLTYSHERGIGENIACLWGSEVTGSKVTQIWYEESLNYDYSQPRVTPNTRPFCQVVWEGTRELGAGKASTKSGKQVVVARYNPPATRKQVEKNVKSSKLDKIDGSTPLATKSSLGLRKFQEECLFAHNEFRVLHGAPPLHWSPSLAWAAQQWAEQLVHIGELKHNNDEMVGENLAGMVGDELTGKECTDMWYEEVKDFDFEKPCYSEETSNFTQVVWIGSDLFGVGRASLGDTCIVVAFYEPPGNIEGLFGANVRLQGTKVKSYRLNKEMKTFIPPSPDLEWFRIESLVAHNYFRARHAAPPLVISQALNEEAQYWAERLLVTGATEDLQESRIGVNVAIINGHHVSGLKVTELWYDEGTSYDFESPGFGLSTRSFTQLIWLTSRKLGIGKAVNNTGQCVIVARYEPVGNIDGLFVSNVRRRGHERNSLEPMVFETDVKYRFKIEGRRSFRMSWEMEGTQPLQVVEKTREKNRLVWIESPVLPRKQIRESCDLEMEKSDDDKESGVEEGEDFDQEGTEPEPEEGRVLSRVAYFEHFEKIEKEKLDRPKRSSIELKTHHDQFGDEVARSHKINEHEETVCQLEFDDVFPKHDENDERDEDFASEGEAEDDDDDVMSLETVSEAEEDLLEELDEFEMDHHIKSYCYEVNYVRDEDESNIIQDTTTDACDEKVAEKIKTELDNDKTEVCLDPDYCIESSVDRDANVRDQMRTVDSLFEFIPLKVEKRRTDFNPDDVNFDETEEEKEMFKFETKTVEKSRTSKPLCTETIYSQTRNRLECELNFEDMFFRLDKPEKPKEKPPPTLPKPKRKPKEDVPAEPKTEVIQTVESIRQTTETVHRVETGREPVTIQKEEIVQDFKEITEEKPPEIKAVEVEPKEESEGEGEALGSDEEAFESFDVAFIDRERKINNIFKRLGRRIELIPTKEIETTPIEFDRKIDLSHTREEDEELFGVYKAPTVVKTWNKDPVQEKTIYADEKKRDVESEIDFEELFERLEKGEETLAKKPVIEEKEPPEDLVVLESEVVEEQPQEEKTKVVRFDKTVIVQEHETVYRDFVELKEEDTASDDYQYCEEESSEDVKDHGEEFEEVNEARTEELQQISAEPSVHLAHEVEETSELAADVSDQEEAEAQSLGEEEDLRTSVSPMNEEEISVQFSEERSERNSYATCDVDTSEPSDSVADVYEEYESTPVKYISEASCSQPIHVAADVEIKPLESGVEEKSVRTSMYESFEEVVPEASASPVIEPSTCYVAAEINHRETEVEPVKEEVGLAALSSDEEPETTDKVAVRGIPEFTESTVCITTETTYHHTTEIVQKRAPSIELEVPLQKDESVEEEASCKEILPNGHCTSVHISHNLEETKTEVITESETYETDISQEVEEDKIAVSEIEADYVIPSNISVESQLSDDEGLPEEIGKDQSTDETLESYGGEREEEEVEPLEEVVPAMEDVEESVDEREAEKVEETTKEKGEEAEQPEEAESEVVERMVDETVAATEEERVEETVVEKEEEEVEQLEETDPVLEYVKETAEEMVEESVEGTEEEEKEIVQEAKPEKEEKEDEMVDKEEEVQQEEEPVPVEERAEKEPEETALEKEEEEVKKVQEAENVEEVEETVETTEDERVDETAEEKEEEAKELEEAEPEVVDGMTEEREEEEEEIAEEKGEEEVEELEELEPVPEDVEETIEEREEGKTEQFEEVEQPEEEEMPVVEDVQDTIVETEKVEEIMQETDGTENVEQLEENGVQQVVEVEHLQPTALDDRFEYISEEELEETEELYERLRESFEEQNNEELIDEENVHVQQTTASVIHIGSQEDEDEEFGQEPASEDEITYDSEVITEVEKEITSVLVVKESFSSAVYEDETSNENIGIEKGERKSPVEETQPEALLQFSEQPTEDVPQYCDEGADEREPDSFHEEGFEDNEVFEQLEPSAVSPDIEECEELESPDEIIDKVELIQFTEETADEKKMQSSDEVFVEEDKAVCESPTLEDLGSSEEFVDEDVELIQFTEQNDEDKAFDEDFEVDESYPISPDGIEEKQLVTESGVELIQFTEQVDEDKVDSVCESAEVIETEEDDVPVESSPPGLDEHVESKEKDEEERAVLIQFTEHSEEQGESSPNFQAEQPIEEYEIEDSRKMEVEEELVISDQPIACSTPIFFTDEKDDQTEETPSFEDSAEAGFGENYEDMEKIIAPDHSLDISQPFSLEESSEISGDFYQAEAEEVASKTMAEEFDDSIKLEAETESMEEVEEQKEQKSAKSTSIVTTTFYEERISKTEHTKKESVDVAPLESPNVTEDGLSHHEDHFSPPPKITATEFVADEEEEGSEEEYLPKFEHPRTYMMESKEVVMDRNATEPQAAAKEDEDENVQVEKSEKEEEEEPAVEGEAPTEMLITTETSEAVEGGPEKVEDETTTTTVIVSHRSEVVRKQDSDVDDLEEKELEERIQKKQQVMEECFLRNEMEIKNDTPDEVTTPDTKSEEGRTELYFTSISIVKVQREDDEERIFWEEEATNKMRQDELKLEEKEPSREEMDVMREDEALTEAAFRAEKQDDQHEADDISDEPDQGRKGDEVAQMPILPLMAASDVVFKTLRQEREVQKDMAFQEEVEVSKTDIAFTEEIEVERVHETKEQPEEVEEKNESTEYTSTDGVYEEEIEIQRVEHHETEFEEEYHEDEVFEEEVMIEKIEEEHEEEQESSPDVQTLPVFEEELEVAAADQIPEPQQDVEEQEEGEGEGEEAIVHAEPVHEDAGENVEVEGEILEEEQAWEEYEEMEEQDQEIPQEIQGIADQSDMHLYDNNNNESLPRYYVDFSPGGSFERESTTSDDGEGPEVYRQGQPIEEDMEEFILVKYEDQSSSSGDDISDHREMYVIHEEDSEDRADEKKETTEESVEDTVSYDQGFVNPALEDIREEEEDNKQKQEPQEEEEVDIEEKRQLEEYERLESFVILEEKLSQVESDESMEELTSGTDGKRASSEETLNDEDELSETRTSSTLKDDIASKDESGDEASCPDSHEPSELDSTLTKEVEEEIIDLEDGGVLSKRTIREETYTVEEDDGNDDDDDKDKTLTRKRVSKKVITTTTTSETHVTRIASEDQTSPSGSDNESEQTTPEIEEVTSTSETETEQPVEQVSRDEETDNRTIETEEETIVLDDGGVTKKFITREETYTVEEGTVDQGDDDPDSSLTRKTVTRKVVTTTTTSTSRVTQLSEEPSSSCSDDDPKVVESSSEETHTTIIKSRQPEKSLISAKRQISLENAGNSSEACADHSRKQRGCIKRFDSHESEGNSSEVSSTTDSTGDSTSMSSEDHVSDEDFSGLNEFQIDCIRQHNIYRHRHRACRLVWSEDLAAAAATWADHLAATSTLEHSPQKETGENLACAKGYDLRGDKVAEMWYDEIEDYNFETPAFNAKCGHFTQMIWRGTKEFGVAKSIAVDGSQYVVARYHPPGNVLGEFKDSIRRARGQRSNVRKRRRSSNRRQLSHSSDVSDVLQREKFKNECVISHNYYRSLHGAPPLQWSTLLANEAQTFAEKLTKSGSFMHSGSKEIGECLAFSFGLDLSGRDAVDTWYDEIVDYDYEYPGYTSHTANFTQLIWAGTKEFGIAKAVGEDGSCVVVGRYYPPGNIVGEFQENVKQKGSGYY